MKKRVNKYAVYHVNVRMLRSMTNLPVPSPCELVKLFTNIVNVVVGYGLMKS